MAAGRDTEVATPERQTVALKNIPKRDEHCQRFGTDGSLAASSVEFADLLDHHRECRESIALTLTNMP